ncbi:MAG: aldo/keto reductase [Proteobacteria bacterium]|nr:aldo/keto reductase [Pseudomonadota bacterium]
MSELPAPPQNRPLYPNGPVVSQIAWGMWRYAGDDLAAAEARVRAALEAGVNLFDTADVYGPDNGEKFGSAEALLGRVLAKSPDLKTRMVLATKGGINPGVPYDSSAAYVASAIDASLKRLGVEQVALWQIHRADFLAHPAETAGALAAAHKAGKIAAAGVSNFAPHQVEALAAHLPLPLVATQPEFSPLAVRPLFDGVLDQAMAKGIAVLAWSPLGGGRLGEPKDDRAHAVAKALDAKAAEAGVSRAAAAYSWIMAHPARPIPIVGTQRVERIAEIPQAYRATWTRAEWYQVLTASLGESLP